MYDKLVFSENAVARIVFGRLKRLINKFEYLLCDENELPFDGNETIYLAVNTWSLHKWKSNKVIAVY